MAETNKNAISMENMGNSFDQILNESLSKVSQDTGAGVATKKDIDFVIMEIISTKKLSVDQNTFTRVALTICHLMQIGATSPKYAESKMVTEYGVDISVGDLRNACKKNGLTVRKLARGMRNDIIKVAVKHNLPGNFVKSYKLENPQFEAQDLPWISDFQTFSDDAAMPEHIKQSIYLWLLENYRGKFRPTKKDEKQ